VTAVIGALLSWLGFALICLTHPQHRRAAEAHLPLASHGALRWAGWGTLAASVAYLAAREPGDIGLIVWFGLHPVLILAISLLAERAMRTLVLLAKASPIAIVVLGIVEVAIASG